MSVQRPNGVKHTQALSLISKSLTAARLEASHRAHNHDHDSPRRRRLEGAGP